LALIATLHNSEEANTRIGVLQGEKEIAIAHHLLIEVPLLVLFTHSPSPSLTYSVYRLRFSLRFERVFNFPKGEMLPLSATLLAELAAWRGSPIYHEYQELDTP